MSNNQNMKVNSNEIECGVIHAEEKNICVQDTFGEGLIKYLSDYPGFRPTGRTIKAEADTPENREKCYKGIAELLSCSSNPDDIRNNIAHNIRQLREQLEMTAEEVAGEIGVSRQYIGQLESGKKVPSLDILCELADLFGVSAAALISTVHAWNIRLMLRYMVQEHIRAVKEHE